VYAHMTYTTLLHKYEICICRHTHRSENINFYMNVYIRNIYI
jgi:hypothetical protein